MRYPANSTNSVPASEKDYGEVVALLEAASLPTEDLERSAMAHFLLAHDVSGNLMGAIGVEHYGRDALLRSLVVAPEYRNRKLGTKLVADLESRSRSLAVANLFLLTTSARDFFIRQGYQAIGRESVPAKLLAAAEFTRLCPDSAVCMTKSL
ncbi:MAG TPA: arsenic resistance N-acetyltransferase ArsN2 [Burkholderiales bacterium]|nr:arsenic resistance N-acetyltransferase ArsN2 [Burkholderiales bacterium]